jgi:rod shape-determining protein MreC
MLDLGSDSGVKIGQPVIDARGLVGQIVEVRPRSCTVLLISDKSHAVPVRIERTGLRTIARGTGALDTLELPNIPTSADVKPGDKLVTSGLGGRFPADFPVGVIRSVGNSTSGMFATAQATPDAALDRSAEVLVLHELANPVGPPAPVEEIGPPAALAQPPAAAPAQTAAPQEGEP